MQQQCWKFGENVYNAFQDIMLHSQRKNNAESLVKIYTMLLEILC